VGAPLNVESGAADGNIEAIMTVAFAIEMDFALPGEQLIASLDAQVKQIKDNKSVLSTDDLAASRRYGAFYISIDNRMYVLGALNTLETPAWPEQQTPDRISLSQAVDLAFQLGKKNKARKVTVITADPDVNEGMYQVSDDPSWLRKNLPGKRDFSLQSQMYYLTIP
jgi:hypothetical protein